MKEALGNLRISGIFGSSSSSRTCFSTAGDLVAYAASGGVVVTELDVETKEILKQRFFCASSKPQRLESLSPSGFSKDQNGLIKPEHSIVIKGDTWTDNDELPEKTMSIGSDLTPARCSPSKIRDRIKDITCLSLSRDGKFLIVGEAGHQPRILLYSMAADSNDFPVFVIHQHSFGISQLEFHPEDGSLFTSLGLINDGFLHVWKLSSTSVRLIASNKNSTIVNGINWYKDSAIVTYGVRQIKVWKFENPNYSMASKITQPRTRTVIKGKNIVLGSLIESTFMDCEWLRDDQLLFLTDSGQVVLYHNGSLVSLFEFESAKKYDNILVDWDNDKLWFSYENIVDSIPLTFVLNHQERLRPGSGGMSSKGGSPIKNNLFEQKHVESEANVKDQERILMMTLFVNKSVLFSTSKGEISLISDSVKQVSNPSLNDINVFKKIQEDLIVICSKKGDIKLFNGKCLIESDLKISLDLVDEEVTALDLDIDQKLLAVGDSSGKLSIYQDESCTFSDHIHTSAINDIRLYQKNGLQILITISRDRTIHFVEEIESTWTVIESIKENKGNILQLLVSEDRLYAISSDRTVSCYRLNVVDNKLDVFKETILSVKSSPLKMQATHNDLVVSRSDKTIQIFDKRSNTPSRVLRLVDEQNDGILINDFYVNAQSDQILCSSSLDKTIRCFNYTTGKCINQYYAHSDPVIGMTTVAGKFVTVTGNGCLFAWEMRSSEDMLENTIKISEPFTSLANPSSPSTPIRHAKVISPLKVQHPTPTNSPIRREMSFIPPKRGIIPSNQLKSRKDEPRTALTQLKQLRLALMNDEEVEGIDEIKKEILLIHSLLEPQEQILQKFGDELVRIIESRLA